MFTRRTGSECTDHSGERVCHVCAICSEQRGLGIKNGKRGDRNRPATGVASLQDLRYTRALSDNAAPRDIDLRRGFNRLDNRVYCGWNARVRQCGDP